MNFSSKIIIPEKVELKIRYVCSKEWNNEWSGILFYKPEGNYKDNNIVITCHDFIILDIGNNTFTEFELNPDVIAYMTDHDLLDCKTGLIHSHDTMATFFSGTDQDTLRKEGANMNNFVSLIVNDKGDYTAAMTRKIRIVENVSSIENYDYFDCGSKSMKSERKRESNIIEWHYLNVNKELVSVNTIDVDKQLFKIKDRQEKEREKAASYQNGISHPNNFIGEHKTINLFSPRSKVTPIQRGYNAYDDPDSPLYSGDDEYDSPNLFSKDESYNNTLKEEKKAPDKEFTSDDLQSIYHIPLNNDVINSLLLEIVTGSVVVSNKSKIDIIKWSSTMNSVFDTRFNYEKNGMWYFEIWMEGYIDSLLSEVTEQIPETEEYDGDAIESVIASSLIKELQTIPGNKYIKTIINILNSHITC